MINDPRTTTLVQPLSAYGGVRVTWCSPGADAEPIIRKY